jgi:hypothetical protein
VSIAGAHLIIVSADGSGLRGIALEVNGPVAWRSVPND